eukprot:13604-Pyramimonas_sp.AAC.1
MHGHAAGRRSGRAHSLPCAAAGARAGDRGRRVRAAATSARGQKELAGPPLLSGLAAAKRGP